MSQVKRETIECPNCHRKGEFEIWDSVNVDLDPELREKIFNEELFMYHCPHCEHVTGIPLDTLYHDMKNQFMLFFSFFKEDDFDYKRKHSKKCTFYTLRFGCSFAAVNTIKPQLL